MSYEVIGKSTCSDCGQFCGLITSDGKGPTFNGCKGFIGTCPMLKELAKFNPDGKPTVLRPREPKQRAEAVNHVYEGTFYPEDEYRYRVTMDGVFFDPKPSLRVRNHSPTGFSWSFGGSGPAQLSLAILLMETTRDIAITRYQAFKWDVIAKLPKENWTMDSKSIQDWLAKEPSTDWERQELTI